jgi:bacterioferritin (cytochrome b1)
MAAEQLEDASLFQDIVKNLENNEEITCQCCVTLKADLQKAKQDISPYREIIKILLEEQSSTKRQQLRTDEPRREEESFHPISRGTLMKVIFGADQTEQPYTSNSNCKQIQDISYSK